MGGVKGQQHCIIQGPMKLYHMYIQWINDFLVVGLCYLMTMKISQKRWGIYYAMIMEMNKHIYLTFI